MNEYVSHIVDQTTRNVEFLVDRGHISRQDGNAILSKLPSSTGGDATEQVEKKTGFLPLIGRRNTPATPVPPARSNVVQARALWAYNEHGGVRSITTSVQFIWKAY